LQVCYAQWELDAHAEQVTSYAATGVNGFTCDAEASLAMADPVEDFSTHANALDSRTNQMNGSTQEADGRPTFDACFTQEYFLHPIMDILGSDTTSFERLKIIQDGAGKDPHVLFADQDKWKLVQWLVKNANQCMTEEFLKLRL
jgi:hypothetical protein